MRFPFPLCQVRLEHLMESRASDFGGLLARNEEILAANSRLENDNESLRSSPSPPPLPSLHFPTGT